jgi:tRNA (guanine37-N1)-methyltransferase
MRFHIVSLFPESIDSYIGASIIKRAIEDKKISIYTYNPKDFATEKGARVDRRPYGGGPGMVMQAEPVAKAILKALRKIETLSAKKKPSKKTSVSKTAVVPAIKILFFKPRAKVFTNTDAIAFAKKYTDIIFVCGRYEGVDARIKKMIGKKIDDISVGDFVLTGGELPALIVLDAVSRHIEGVLGDFDSREESRTASSDVYTRPEVIMWKGKKLRVPKVLLGGNHAEIEKWRASHI